MCVCVHVDQNSDYLPHRGEAPGPVKNGVNFSSYGKAKNSLSMATERVLKGGNTEHAISDPLFVQALTHSHTQTQNYHIHAGMDQFHHLFTASNTETPGMNTHQHKLFSTRIPFSTLRADTSQSPPHIRTSKFCSSPVDDE